MKYEFHPLANIFPLIDGQAYKDLLADILAHGVHEPVWLYEGKILDGRNRYRAATAMRVECPVREYTGDDATGFVLSLNLHRRHLSESQRAMVAAKLANIKNGGDRHSDQSANLQTDAISQPEAAAMLNVSTRSVAAASKVLHAATEAAVHAVEAGDVSINLATQFQALPEQARKDAIEAIAKQEPAKEVMRAAVKKEVEKTNAGRVAVKPDESRLYEEGSSLSAMVLSHRAQMAITQINRNDPKAIEAIENIRVALDRHLQLITK